MPHRHADAMSRLWRSTLLTVASLAVATVGAVDAARGRDGDLVAVFLTIVALQAAVLAVHHTRDRRSVPVRRDLADWLDDRAQQTGDTVDQVVDRMVVQYRSLWPPLR